MLYFGIKKTKRKDRKVRFSWPCSSNSNGSCSSCSCGGRGARCSSVVRAFAYGVMGCRIDPS